MKLEFPEGFLWGTGTASCHTEVLGDNDWRGYMTKDGKMLDRNIEHDLHRDEDADLIAELGNAYRFNFDWAKLQREPKGQLEIRAVEEYRNFLEKLKDKKMHLMAVLHHFSNPRWFVDAGGWTSKESAELFEDYAKKFVAAFGDLIDSWNTINEPAAYMTHGYLLGYLPPKKKDIIAGFMVLENLSKAHKLAYNVIKEKFPEKLTGISTNTLIFYPENPFGVMPAKIIEHFTLEHIPDMFKEADFNGISYYGKIPFAPGPITEALNPGELEKLGKIHDKIWEYYPKGIEEVITRFWNKNKKPVIITENGCCTDDDKFRVKSIKEHLKCIHEAVSKGVDVKGYFHWTVFDCPEAYLGEGFPFGLVSVDENMKRKLKESGKFYLKIGRENALDMD